MTTLTEAERAKLAKAPEALGLARPVQQWQEILAGLTPDEAAARIFGDLMCYTADRKVARSITYERRSGFLADVRNVANALQAWKQIKEGE